MAAAAYPILLLTCSLALSQPRIGRMKMHQAWAGLIGAALTLVSGAVSLTQVVDALRFLSVPLITIVSLMVMTVVADHSGLFRWLALQIARTAKGNARRLFFYIFGSATLVGAFFTNDAAVLIFTPLVFTLMEDVELPGWTMANKVPFYFAVLYVANLAGGLMISNPINIVVGALFSFGFLEYAAWMALPALVSMIVTYAGLRLYFGRDIPLAFDRSRVEQAKLPLSVGAKASAVVLGATLIGFFLGNSFGLPAWKMALGGAITSVGVALWSRSSRLGEIAGGIGWDVIVFVAGMFIISRGLRNAGLTHAIQDLLVDLGGRSLAALSGATSVVAAVASSLINNHPAADTMAFAISDMATPAAGTLAARKVLALAALIGGDLGPKMLPIGSLAAMMWFRLLRDRGVNVSFRQYVRIGVPVTLAAIFLSVLILILEARLRGIIP